MKTMSRLFAVVGIVSVAFFATQKASAETKKEPEKFGGGVRPVRTLHVTFKKELKIGDRELLKKIARQWFFAKEGVGLPILQEGNTALYDPQKKLVGFGTKLREEDIRNAQERHGKQNVTVKVGQVIYVLVKDGKIFDADGEELMVTQATSFSSLDQVKDLEAKGELLMEVEGSAASGGQHAKVEAQETEPTFEKKDREILPASKEDLQGERKDYTNFSKWGLSFDYPKVWQEHPPDRVAMMKEYLERELRPYGRDLQEFAMIVGPNDETALLVSKYSTPKAMKPSEFVEERKQVYGDAMRAGDVTSVNHVKETTIGNLPAVEEDVERSNGGRGRTFKIIDGTTVFEISFVAQKASLFSEYSAVLDHLVSSIMVVGKTEGSLKTGGQQ